MSKLKLINGVVKDLCVVKNYEDFAFTHREKNLAGVSAVGAVAIDQLFNSAVLASASHGAEISMDFFTCTVNEELLAGRFYQVQFQEGDTIDFIVERSSAGNVVHAARSPSKRLLYMLPYQIRGEIAQKFNDINWTLVISIFTTLTIVFCEFYFFPDRANRRPLGGIVFFTSIFIGLMLINIWVRSRFYRHSKQATEVIRALGYKNPERIDLQELSKIAEKRMQRQTGKCSDILSPWSFWY